MPAIFRLGSPRYGFKGMARPLTLLGIMREKFFANYQLTRFQQIAGRAGMVGGMLHVAGLQRWVFNMKRAMFFIENIVLIAVERACAMFGREMIRVLDAKLAHSKWSRGKAQGSLRTAIRWGLMEVTIGMAMGAAYVDQSVAPHVGFYIHGLYPVSQFTIRSKRYKDKGYIIVPIKPKVAGGEGVAGSPEAPSGSLEAQGVTQFRTHKRGVAWTKKHHGFDFVTEAHNNKFMAARRLVNSAIRGTMRGMKLGMSGAGAAFVGGGKLPRLSKWPRAKIDAFDTEISVWKVETGVGR